MTGCARAWFLAIALAAAIPVRAEPTYLFEWLSRGGRTTTRLTLFRDRVLVRKVSVEGEEARMRMRKLSQEEYDFYASYFGDPKSTDGEGPHESSVTGEMITRSKATFCLPDGARWSLSWDSFAALPMSAMRVRSALEGLADSFGKVLPDAADFAADKIPPGTILRRRDGQRFEVVRVDEQTGQVEIRGVTQPFSEILLPEQLRFTFLPP